MSSDAPESAQHSVSDLLYRDIFPAWAWMMDCDIEQRTVDKNLAGAAVSDSAIFIVPSCVLRLFLRILFGTLFGVIASVKLGGTTEYYEWTLKFYYY